MNWTRQGKYALVSECKRYSIASVKVGSAWSYELWRDQVLTGTHPTSGAAKEAAEKMGATAE